ncbi:MAG: three-Cys-motif partner protein TcmP [Lachnospiraceae bacterium]|nr:three-Cys-motif partner protein TcmP [Lachnospiraceae bacterium]
MAKDNTKFFEEKNSWSLIKDKLLGYYLVPYFQKVLMTGKPIFYVDCFAGKGRFEDGNLGSPLIALQIREDCLKRTKRKDKVGAIKTCFIDLNYAGELKENISSVNPVYDKPIVISGRYEEEIEQCLQDKHDNNVFLYIDPYGIKALDSNLFDKFQTYGFYTFEMLINFNSFGFFRDACRVMNVDYKNDNALSDLDDLVEYEPTVVSTSKQSEDLLTRIAGGDYWKHIVLDYRNKKINGYQAEKRLSVEYKQWLKQRYKYVLDMPIRLKEGQRPKYRMIHVCDHEDGCFLMAQNMQKQKKELFFTIQQNRQLSLFDMISDYTSSVEGELLTKKEIRQKVEESLKQIPHDIGITKFLAIFINENGLICEFKMIYDILSELTSEGMIDIIRIPEKTDKGHLSTFWEEKKGQSVIIRGHRP